MGGLFGRGCGWQAGGRGAVSVRERAGVPVVRVGQGDADGQPDGAQVLRLIISLKVRDLAIGANHSFRTYWLLIAVLLCRRPRIISDSHTPEPPGQHEHRRCQCHRSNEGSCCDASANRGCGHRGGEGYRNEESQNDAQPKWINGHRPAARLP